MDSKDVQIAWAAGLFEGEGTIGTARGKYPRASMASADYDVVKRFAEIVGVGGISGPTQNQRFPDRKPMWSWQITKGQDFVTFASMVEQHLGERRRQRLQEVRTTSRLADPRYLEGDLTRVQIPVDEAIALYANGASLREVGDQLGVSAAVVASRLKARGVQLRRATWPEGHSARVAGYGGHMRHHVQKGITKPGCQYCEEALLAAGDAAANQLRLEDAA